jgi:predicted nucleic acid-binding protein
MDFVNRKDCAIDLEPFLLHADCFASVITKLELLGYAHISTDEEQRIMDFLSSVVLLPLDEQIEGETILIRRATSLKLPDAIIGATAVVLGADIVTRDADFLTCAYPALHVRNTLTM